MPNFLTKNNDPDQWTPGAPASGIQGALPEIQQGLKTAAQAFESPAQAATRVAQEDKATALFRQRNLDAVAQQHQAVLEQQQAKTLQLTESAQQETHRKNVETEKTASDKLEAQLRGKGFKTNALTGDIENVPFEELSPAEQAKVGSERSLAALRAAQADKAEATKSLDYDKYLLAERNTRVAEQGLGLRQQAELRRGKAFDLSAGKESVRLYDPALDADKRLKVMMDNAKDASGQGDISLLFNHIGMTLSAQKGARVTEAEIQNAITARSVPEDLLAMYTKAKNGQFLTPDQRSKMVNLAVSMREEMWDKAERQGAQFGEDSGITAPTEHAGLPARADVDKPTAKSGTPSAARQQHGGFWYDKQADGSYKKGEAVK